MRKNGKSRPCKHKSGSLYQNYSQTLENLGKNQKDEGLDQQVDITEARERERESEANSCRFPKARKATPN